MTTEISIVLYFIAALFAMIFGSAVESEEDIEIVGFWGGGSLFFFTVAAGLQIFG